MQIWNPWHGCHKISPGCQHCYMFRRDAEFDKDSTLVCKTASFSLPVRKKRDGSYTLAQAEQVYACMTSGGGRGRMARRGMADDTRKARPVVLHYNQED